MTVIETARLIIRNFGTDDWQDLREVIITYQASEFAQYDHKWPTAAEELKGITEWFAAGDRYLVVCLKPTGKLIGLVALNPSEANYPSCQLLRRLGMKETGQHTEALQTTEDGEPVAFAGLTFAISREEWAANAPAVGIEAAYYLENGALKSRVR